MLFRDFVKKLEDEKLLIRIKKPISVKYEIATLMKKLDGKPLLFENVKGYDIPVVANVCSTRQLVAIGLGIKQREMIKRLTNAIDNPKEPKVKDVKGYREIDVDLTKLPVLTYYKIDGGPYIASGIAIAKDEEYGLNASYHRAMVIDKNHVVM
ncbi:MAG: UbiD family decarboxylase, partial [Thermoplasmata archaeon]